MRFNLKTGAALLALSGAPMAMAAATGGYAGDVTGGGSKTAVSVSTASAMQAAIDAYDGSSGLVIRYTGSFNFASITDACTQWQKPAGTVVEIKNKSNVTIEGADGSGANFGLAVKGGAENIIIRNMTIGLLPGSIDAIGIEGQGGKYPGYIWVDHNTLFSSTKECSGAGDMEFDGLIDSKAGAHHITYSYNYIHDHQKVGLIGSSDSDSSDRYITFHHNYYQNVNSRLPLQRGGYTHIYNNLYSGVNTSGINVRMGGYSLIEGNYFENVQNPVTSRDSTAIGYWDLRNNNITSTSDFGKYGITWVASGSTSKPSKDATDWSTTRSFPKSIPYSYSVQTAACIKSGLPAVAGAGKSLRTLTSCSGSSAASSASSSKSSSSAASSVASSSSSSKSSAASSSSSAAATGSIPLTASAGAGQVVLNWSFSNLTPAAVEVYRDTDSNPSGRVRIASVSSSTRTYTDSSVVAGTTYYYWIKNTTNGVITNSAAASATPTAAAPVLAGSGDYPDGFSKCADLGGTCSVASGSGWVAFGRKGSWVAKFVGVGNSTACTVAAFGSDPAGNPNKCSYQR